MGCKVEGCQNWVKYTKKMLCARCYQRMHLYGTFELDRKKPRTRINRKPAVETDEYTGMGYVLTLGVNHDVAR